MASAQAIPINWALTGVAAGFAITRYSIRGYIFRSHFTKWSLMDDIFYLLSFVFLVVHGFTNINAINASSQLKALLAMKPPAPTADILSAYRHLVHLNLVVDIILYIDFWLVKFSFLMFYRHLFDISTAFRKAWWVVLVFTFVTLWIPLGGIFGVCAGASSVADYKNCTAVSFARSQRLEYTCASIVASDLAIMALPLWMLKSLKLHALQKAGLAFVFSFGLVIVAIDILRTVESVGGNQALYIILEVNFSVIIACLPTLRTLLNMQSARKGRQGGPGSRRGSSSSWMSAKLGSWSKSLFAVKFGSFSGGSNPSQHQNFSKMADDAHLLRSDLESGNPSMNSDRCAKGFDVPSRNGKSDPIELQTEEVEFSGR